jgi:hypothetical protein
VNRDGQIRAFLAALWLSAILLLFGVELRLWFAYSGASVLAVFGTLLKTDAQARVVWIGLPPVLVALFVAVTFFLRRRGIARLRRRGIRVRFEGGVRSVLPRPMPDAALVDAVKKRAADLFGEDDPRAAGLCVLHLPATWEITDAFVIPEPEGQALVLTGGARVLRDREPELFDALVDHELGHVCNDDVPMLYLANAILRTCACFAPLKGYFVYLVYSFRPDELYSIVPARLSLSATNQYGSGGLEVVGRAATTRTFFVSWGLTEAAIALLLVASFVMIVRRRELWADMFVAEHRGENGRRALATLLLRRPLPRAPAQSFQGAASWHHPSHRTRAIRLASASRGERVMTGIAVALLVTALWLARLCWLDIFASDQGSLAITGGLISVALFLIVVGALTNAGLSRVPAARGPVAALRDVIPAPLIGSAVVSALGLALVLFEGRMEPDLRLEAAGYGFLRNIETAFLLRDTLMGPVLVTAAYAAGVLVEWSCLRAGLSLGPTVVKLGVAGLATLAAASIGDTVFSRAAAAYAIPELEKFRRSDPGPRAGSYMGFGPVLYLCCNEGAPRGALGCRGRSCRDGEVDATNQAIEESASSSPLASFWLMRPSFRAALYGEDRPLLGARRDGLLLR